MEGGHPYTQCSNLLLDIDGTAEASAMCSQANQPNSDTAVSYGSMDTSTRLRQRQLSSLTEDLDLPDAANYSEQSVWVP
jgi:hypothetical protein